LRLHTLVAAVLVTLLFSSAATHGEESQANYLAGTLIDIQKNVETTPRVWLWNTVVAASETVRYQLRIRVGNQIYVSEYVPLIQPDGGLPVSWKPNSALELRIEKHSLFVRLSYGGEIETRIMKHEAEKVP
jgi:hypothetical protein